MTASGIPARNAVEAWFGPQFEELHPALQALHRDGGWLSGPIAVTDGQGLAGWLGRRLAHQLGIPTAGCAMTVEIKPCDNALNWSRRFGSGSTMLSIFEPHGSWPDGDWSERSGPLRLRLTVDVIDGGWYWRCLGVQLFGLPLPQRLLPRLRAYKRYDHGLYRFGVSIALPLLGTVLSYGGSLQRMPSSPS